MKIYYQRVDFIFSRSSEYIFLCLTNATIDEDRGRRPLYNTLDGFLTMQNLSLEIWVKDFLCSCLESH